MDRRVKELRHKENGPISRSHQGTHRTLPDHPPGSSHCQQIIYKIVEKSLTHRKYTKLKRLGDDRPSAPSSHRLKSMVTQLANLNRTSRTSSKIVQVPYVERIRQIEVETEKVVQLTNDQESVR